MSELRYRTAGESHGPALLAVVEGIPAGLRLEASAIDGDLARRQGGYGRSRRQALERDRVRILSGLKGGATLGSPIALLVGNADASIERLPNLRAPRPGHADLAGCLKYGTRDVRAVLERSSARETVARVAAGAVARALLREFAVEVFGYVLAVGGVRAAPRAIPGWRGGPLEAAGLAILEEARAARDASPFASLDPRAAGAMRREVETAAREGDTVGGLFEVVALGVPPGLGSFATGEGRIDGRLARAMMSIPAVKGVEIGLGFAAARMRGSRVHDPILRREGSGWAGWARHGNRAGGIEGGVTNGEPLLVRAAMKPLPTLRRGLPSVNLETRAPERGTFQRSDVCAVPAASVVGEAAVAFEIARAFLEKFGGDSISEVSAARRAYLGSLETV
ncbi:MAG TPA: chorismate synthase [Planctomycetota bacterium]|nr:chorismate synthase [Planctomycetota bacterium]